ncbi:helix-turn-helix domain-containing protein [Paenibacillus sp. D2_2]|uniref:TetR/AcrR family transcriptional regulator n=1 Tax=Paenibacillus sp. D2_2 TaxID=3073092 RepID=UPI002816456B|nr:helix-turn-helix domain-containing protein [Paenibacillus sp. D2_2]WMT43275.1 helix-turn-helix domain-containing protein [Paenibacillus sp. D2_2]
MNQKKINVILAAHKLFKDKGYIETSILDIVKESNTSRGTFYNYFSSKAELLVEMNQYFEDLLNQERTLFTINYQQGDSVQLLREILYLTKKENWKIN